MFKGGGVRFSTHHKGGSDVPVTRGFASSHARPKMMTAMAMAMTITMIIISSGNDNELHRERQTDGTMGDDNARANVDGQKRRSTG